VSDSSQGPGWWQASDGKWYPPEQAPGYQQPAPGGPYGAPYGGGGPGGGGAAGGTDVGTTLSYAWNKFIQNIGEWVVLWLITVGIRIVIGIIGAALGVGAGVAGMSGGGSFGLTVALGIVSAMVSGLLLVVLAKAAAQAVNGQSIDIGAAFQLTGNNISVGLIFGAITGVVGIIPCLGIFLQIGCYLLLGFALVLTALDDKGTDALGESVSLSTGKPGEAMVFWLIGGIISLCCFLLGAPVTVIGAAYLVKRYRGESVAP
jgi:hypothetical protein